MLPASPEGQLPGGFLSEEQWKATVGAVQNLAQRVRAAGFPTTALEKQATHAAKDWLAAAVVSAVLPLPSVAAVRALAEALDSFPDLLPHLQTARAKALADDLPGRIPDGYNSEPGAGSGDEDPDAAWRRYTSYIRVTLRIRVTDEAQQELLQHLPLSVIDDLIDQGLIPTRNLAAADDRSLYLRARLTPAQVPTQLLAGLGWDDEIVRRGCITRLAEGDVTAIDDLSSYSPESGSLASQLRTVRESGDIPRSLMGRKWLWPVLEKIAPHSPVDLRAQKDFGSWFMVRRTIRMVRNGHLAQLHSEHDRADMFFQRAWDETRALQRLTAAARWEAMNIRAYLRLLSASPNPSYEDALMEIRPSSARERTGEDRLPPQPRANLERNREVIRRLQQRRESDYVLNPYVALGLQDLAPEPEWKDAWRTLRRRLSGEGEAMANQAKDAIQDEERGHAVPGSFRLPLSPEKWEMPPPGNAPFHEGAHPLPRRTGPATPDEREYARSQAAEDILRAACTGLGLPYAAGTSPVPPPESSSK
ncbi:hypothetical protein [Streptomyces sp. NPDC056399]|uniref:hypothetical protein n=1 Tax=Streptomyces sp. NPDC056399 TaxID=3345807 RepID=UPI0035DFB9DE